MLQISDITSERDATNILIKEIERLFEEDRTLEVSHFLSLIEFDQQQTAIDMTELQDKIRLFNYTPTNKETDEQIGRFFFLQGLENAKHILPDMYIHFRNKQFVENYNAKKKYA